MRLAVGLVDAFHSGRGVLHLPDIVEALGLQYQLLQAKGSRLQGDMLQAQQQLQLLADLPSDMGAGVGASTGLSTGVPASPALLLSPPMPFIDQGHSPGREASHPVSYECPDPDRVPPYTVHPVPCTGSMSGAGALVMTVHPHAAVPYPSAQPSPLRGHLVSGSAGGRRSSGGTEALVNAMETHQYVPCGSLRFKSVLLVQLILALHMSCCPCMTLLHVVAAGRACSSSCG
jgi:hypothetical protein